MRKSLPGTEGGAVGKDPDPSSIIEPIQLFLENTQNARGVSFCLAMAANINQASSLVLNCISFGVSLGSSPNLATMPVLYGAVTKLP